MQLETIEELSGKKALKEIELLVTVEELKKFAAYCTAHNIKFNDWIRQLAHDALKNGGDHADG